MIYIFVIIVSILIIIFLNKTQLKQLSFLEKIKIIFSIVLKIIILQLVIKFAKYCNNTTKKS